MSDLRLFLFAALVCFAGCTLLLGQLRWFRRPSLASRLSPHVLGPIETSAINQIAGALLPDFDSLAVRAASVLGIKTELSTRLHQAKDRRTASQFRTSQLVGVVGAIALAIVVSAALRPPPAFIVLLLSGTPILTFLVIEQLLTQRAERNKLTLLNELPTFCEQLAMLLDAGYSLGSAIRRLAQRGAGLIGADMAVVHERTQVGVPIEVAIEEWAAGWDATEPRRLASVLRAGSESGDLGRLVGEEAKNMRRELHRRDLQKIDKQAQQVWIPVTIATLVPGVIVLTIPFLAALDLFTGG